MTPEEEKNERIITGMIYLAQEIDDLINWRGQKESWLGDRYVQDHLEALLTEERNKNVPEPEPER